MEMREKLAEALWLAAASCKGKATMWPTMLEIDREPYFRGADAVLAAMRDRSEAMWVAGRTAILDGNRDSMMDPDIVWKAMLNAARGGAG